MRKSTRNGILVSVLLFMAAGLQAATVVGADTSAAANWRTAAALETDSEYGSDGYIIYGINESDGQYRNPYDFSNDQASLPAYISGIATPANINMWSGNSNFGQLEDPAAGNALTNTSLLAGLVDPHIYTISRSTEKAFRLTVMTASGDNANVTFTVAVDDGSGAVNSTQAHAADGLIYHVFDVDTGSGDVTVSVTCNSNFSVTGFAFDPSKLPLVAVGSDGTTVSNWRTAAALETDNEYGTDGYVVYGLYTPDNTWNSPYDASSLVGTDAAADSAISVPSYIADVSLAANNSGRWSGNSNFGQIEDPAAGNALTNTSVLAWGGLPYVFTVSRSSSDAFRLTVLLTDGDAVDETWDVDVQVGAENASLTTAANGADNTTYAVFDIPSGSDDVVVTISSNVNTWGAITGFAFDAYDDGDGPSEPDPANNPLPTDDQPNVLPLTMLGWTPSPDADSQKVYFGTVSGALSLIADLDAAADGTAPVPSPMANTVEYFWRVDTIADGQTISGPEWSFTTIAPRSCDLNANGSIEIGDALIVAGQWLNDTCGIANTWCGGADLNYTGIVDLFDFSLLANEWGAEYGTDIIFDFETGDLQDWRIVEGGFGLFVCDRDTFHNGGAVYNKQGTYFLSSLETESYTPSDGYTGTAESPVFTLTGPDISLLVGGGNGSATYIALCTVDDDLNEQEVLYARGANTEAMQRINWNAPELVGQKVFVRLRDHSTGGWGHITFDDFSATGVIDSALTARRWANLPLPINLDAARAAVVDLMETYPAEDYPNGQSYLDQLDSYAQQLRDIMTGIEEGTATQADLDALVAVVEDYIRQVLIANPMVSDQPILFIARDQYPGDHHNTHTFFPSYDSEMNNGYFRTGGAMKTVDLGNGGTVTTLVDTPNGMVRDPDVYFDGSKIVFAKRNSTSDNYNLYEINSDGTNLVQLTTIDRVSDLDPIYMPDDTVVFSSTREPKYVHCNRHIQCNLYKMNADGANIHQISNNTLFDFTPSLTDDGRIMYARWEYVDRNFGDAESVWTAHPDGNNHAVYFGNNTISPGAVLDPRQIPGTQQMVCIFGSCHDRPWGALAIVDRRLGVDLPQPGKPNPIQHIWPESAIDLSGGWDGTKPIPTPYAGIYGFDNHVGVSPKYEDPYPLYDPDYPDSTGKYFLVSRMTGSGEKMGIYLVDTFGNQILLHEEASKGCYDPMPIRSRTRPPQIPTLRKYTENTNGKFYVTDVYEGTHMEGVAPGAAKFLRVLEATEKLQWTYNGWSGQGFEGPGMAWHDFYSKKVLGTVPIEDDGSAYFEVPSEVPVYFQLLDENGMMIQSMRSLTIAQPGEMVGCVGCHESRTDAYPVAEDNYYLPTAIQRDADQLGGWYGQTKNYNYLDDVQPVFTANCVSCHGFDTPGGAKAGLLLEPDKEVHFNTSYNELWRKGLTGVVGAGKAPIYAAYSWGSHASPLIAALDDPQHASVTLTAEERDRLITWIDLNAPYYPVYTSAYPGNSAGRSPLSGSQLSSLSSLTGYSFGQKAPAYLSFDRPEKSICLSGLSGSAYDQALAIIQAGADNLAANPRADMAGHVPNATDQARQAKYDMRKIIEWTNRQAIREGWLNYD